MQISLCVDSVLKQNFYSVLLEGGLKVSLRVSVGMTGALSLYLGSVVKYAEAEEWCSSVLLHASILSALNCWKLSSCTSYREHFPDDGAGCKRRINIPRPLMKLTVMSLNAWEA